MAPKAKTRTDAPVAKPAAPKAPAKVQAAQQVEEGDTGLISLIMLFWAWKLILSVIVFLIPENVGYDTSGELWWAIATGETEDDAMNPWRTFLIKLTRWDAIYFADIAKNGYILEQEWAFGWGWTKLISVLGHRACSMVECTDQAEMMVTVGVLLANTCHFWSMVVLHELAKKALGPVPRRDRIAFLAASIYILSPAGVFLVAPYSEALFALVGFLGLYFYATGIRSGNSGTQIITTMISAVLFAGSAMVRGNGLLFASVFGYDVLLVLINLLEPTFSDRAALLVGAFAVGRTATLVKQTDEILSTLQQLTKDFDVAGAIESLGISTIIAILTSIVSIGFCVAYLLSKLPFVKADSKRANIAITIPALLAGLITVAGFAYPQYLAYQEYCTGIVSQPPWCTEFPPSIYTSIQKRYWNVGLFQYWKVSNIPLFLVAGPVLFILFATAFQALSTSSDKTKNPETVAILRRLAIPQLLLGILALTTFHVQIVNRLASGYPLWYFLLAEAMKPEVEKKPGEEDEPIDWREMMVRGMIIYALVQAVLFAGFLPPA